MDETSLRFKFSRRDFVRTAITSWAAGALLTLPGIEQCAQSENVHSVTTRFAPITFRGYGKISAVFRREGGSSILEVTSKDDDKAKLLQAKYLSDLGALPGVTTEPGNNSAVYAVANLCLASHTSAKHYENSCKNLDFHNSLERPF